MGGVLIVMHGRSRMTIDHRIPIYNAGADGASQVFHRPGRLLLVTPSFTKRNARCSANCMNG